MTQELARVNHQNHPQQAVVVQTPSMFALTPERWQMYKEVATHAFKSGFFKGNTSQEACITVMLQGIELGMQPMAALNNIYIVNGRPSLKAQLMAAIIVNAGHPPVETLESTDRIARVRFRRKGSDKPVDISFTWEQAQKAGLTNKDSWKNYPEDMLWNRAVARGARRIFSELFAGLYTPEEMQSGDVVDAEGVVELPQQPAAIPPVAQAAINRYEAGQQQTAATVRKHLTQAQFQDYLKEMKVTPEQIAYRLSAGLVGTVREWLLAHPAPDKDHFRHVLREYVNECNEADDREGQAFNWVWDDKTDLPIETQDIPFAQQPVTHPANTAQIATELKAVAKELGGSVVTTTATEVVETDQPLTGDEFADWIGVISGRDPRTDEKLKAQLLEQAHHKTLSDWWKATRKNSKDPYRVMLKDAVGILRVSGWTWNEATGIPEPKAKPDPWESGEADEVGTEDVPVF